MNIEIHFFTKVTPAQIQSTRALFHCQLSRVLNLSVAARIGTLPMAALDMAPDEARRSRSASPGQDDLGDDRGGPHPDPDDRRYDSTHEVEYDDDANLDEVDVNAGYDDDGYSKEEDEVPDDEDEEPGGGILGFVSYLWMLLALGLFAYLIHKVQAQAGVIKTLNQRAASLEARLGLAPMKPEGGGTSHTGL